MAHMSLSPNSGDRPHHIVILGPSRSLRIKAFQASLKRMGGPTAQVVEYHRFLRDPALLVEALRPGSTLRFETPDTDCNELIALFEEGQGSSQKAGYRTLIKNEISETIEQDEGRLFPPAQLFFGLKKTLNAAEQIADDLRAITTSRAQDILRAMDKTCCAASLADVSIPVPHYIGRPGNFDELTELMKRANKRRVFVKLQHGSSAAGMMAVSSAPDGRMIAYTTADLSESGTLYATRRVQQINHVGKIAEIVNELAPMGLHVEEWVSKAGFHDTNCDLRIITIAGEPVFKVMRKSRHPMTNLHLGGSRISADSLLAKMDPDYRALIDETCRRVARAFPSCFMLGIDLAVLSDLKRHVVLEVNAFGDFVKDVTHDGLTPYDWQVRKLFGRFENQEAEGAYAC